ncbi:MAG: alanine--tRNA ligase [Bacteroidetes bacterium]|nr:alanine--tRNA ligase [Bacteroidota bacterium]
MDSKQVRQAFFEFFKEKQHKIVPSAPMVVKNDPTLMFTNAGMNQFKDIFLGNSTADANRVANTQKCLRVSGKHNDLDEVGHDTYHHTMFEMLGNWSFGDYFKKEAIAWAWELLTKVYKIDPDQLYVTVFGGDPEDNLEPDQEAFDYWKKMVHEDRILYGSKKDNFWEMGDTGPCGPCSEIHVDLRDASDKKKTPGKDLVNQDHPEVIEIWNLVFIEFNRKSDGKLVPLPSKHVDTGMGFERLCMVLQGRKSNYDTDIFQALIHKIGEITGFKYRSDEKQDIAMRVVADHLRAVVFSIADGQLPSNVKAGYVIRRILRRAIRYGFTFLSMQEPFIHLLVPVLVEKMGEEFPEIKSQQDLIMKVIHEEEQTFLRTLSQGIKKFEIYMETHPGNQDIEGSFAFELFDTYGFPVDLTQIMAREMDRKVDMEGFNKGLEAQKNRSRKAAEKSTEDWVVLQDSAEKTKFLGYETTEAPAKILRYRKINEAKKNFYQIVLDQTPFYAESGGQVGDQGYLISNSEKIIITDTQKENELIVHISPDIPADPNMAFTARVDEHKRLLTANNHSATHLMHAALRKVLGDHVEQKGSLVDPERLRFDFSHFAKLTKEEISEIEKLVNEKIRENISINEKRDVPMNDALQMGAMALFGEKYGEKVRVITFDQDYSVELCGGTHVPATGQIGLFKIVSEGAIAAGIRRIEAVTGALAEKYVDGFIDTVDALKELLKNQKDLVRGVQNLMDHNNELKKQIDQLNAQKAGMLKQELIDQAEKINDINFIARKVDLDMGAVKNLAFEINREVDHLFLLLGTENEGKANLTLMISESLIQKKGFNAGKMIRDMARHIQGGGGGQPHFATAGGKNPAGLADAFQKAKEMISD